MATAESWTTIESDPGVFTELIERIGVRGAVLQELYALDGALLQELKPVYGLIFLFKWQPGLKSSAPVSDSDDVWFAQQSISNACATQALLAILLNQPEASLDIGEQLRNLKEFTSDLGPDMRGEIIGNADSIRVAHNSFSPPEAHLTDEKAKRATEEDDVYHFVSYVHKAGAIWELDGLQRGPIKCAECSQEEWLDKIGGVIGERIAAYSAQEIRFNLMALVADRTAEREARIGELEARLAQGDDAALAAERHELQQAVDRSRAQREQWRVENLRRKHNYIPFIFNALQVLAERNELKPLLKEASSVANARVEAAAKRPKAG